MRTLLEIVRDLIIIATGIVGSAFAVYKYRKSREAEGVLQLEIDVDIHKYTAKNLVNVSIKVRNVGKAASFISSDVYKLGLLMVRRVRCPDGDCHIRWEQLENQKLIDDVEFMDTYGSEYPDEPIIFEPNTSETYSVCFSTDYSGPLWIRAELMDKDEYCWITNKLIILPKPQV